ncbi:MAG: hypothetical protein KTR31_20925 [Myxococcales bacterium]|nr:hypothetical protein [Myxococcales bacterium]
MFKDNHPHRPRSPSGPFAPAGPSGAGTKPEAAAELDALYTQALCGCEHCQSVLGPAAYFVDTLFWLQGLDPAAYTELVSRRPDLPALELDCENTETALPYSDLVIEVLEQLVSPDHELDTLPTGTERETEVLLAYPEHGDRLAADRAYTALKQTFHPRLLPYDLALDEVQTYLGHLGVPHVTLIDAFGDLATSTVTAAERAVLGLGGTRAGAAAFTSDTYTSSPESHWGGTPSTWGEDLDQVSVLLERGQIDDADLVLDLLVTRYLNGDDSVGIRLEDAALDACDPANLFLRQDRGTADPANPYPPEDWFYQRLAAFLRLVQWTGWSALDLDKALHALGVERSEPGGTGAGPTPVIQIDGAVLEGLHAQQRLLELTGLDPAELFSWWRGLDTHLDRDNRQADAVVPWYDRTFLDPFTVGTDGEAAFALNAARSELLSPDAVTSPLVHHSAVLSAALGVSETELLHAEEVVTADVGAPGLDLAGLWHLFRWTSLAKAAGLTVREVDLWRTIMGAGSDPFPAGVDDPRRAVRWFEGLQALRTFALDVGEVAWIFGHHADAVATHGPTDAANEALLTTLREALQQLEADQLEPVVDDPTVRAALEEQGVPSDVIDAVIRIIAWDWSDLVPAPATDPSSLPERDATLAQIEHAVDDLDALKSDLRTSLPTAPVAPETFEERLGVLFGHMAPVVAATREREEILAVLEGSYPALTRAHVDVIDAESFSALAGATDPVDALRLDTTLGVTADESATAHQALHLVAKLAHLTQALQLDADSLSEWLVEGTVFGAPDLSGLPVAEDLGALADLWLPLQSALAWFGLDHTLPGTTGAGPEVRSAMREGAALAALSTVSDHLQLDTTSLASLLQAVDARAGAPTAVVAHLALADEGALTASFTVDGHTVTASVTTADPDALLAALASAVASNPDLAWLTAATVDTAGTVVPAGIESLRLSTTSAEHSPFDVSSTSLDVQQGLRDLALLDAVMTRWRHLGTLGVDVATAVSWVTAEPTRAAAAEIRRLARSRAASSAAWSEVGRGLRDDIRRRQQAALFAKVRNDDPTIQSDAAFYAKYLIDPEMDPCMLTSRLKLAISSVQTFVNQCLLGQVTDGAGEPIPFLDSDDETEWRTWRGSYRMWEAARKVYLFPENWLDPSVRVERSPEFERLEDRIRVQTLDAKAADEALATYLREVLPLANPLLACMTHDAEGNIHLLGRAGSQAEKPMYRVARTLPTKNRWRWGAWEQLPFPVPTDERTRVAMYVHGGDVLLVWASLQGEDELGYATELSVFFAIRSQGHWSSPQQAHMQSIDGMDTLDLQMYHHGSAGTLVGWTTLDAVPEGVYAAIAYRDSDGAHGGVALLWSPTLRRFVPNGNMGAQLGNGNLVFEVLSELDAPDIYVPDGDARIRLYHPERSCIAALTLSTPVGAGATSTFDVVDGCIQSSQNGQFENSYAETQDFYADRGFRFESDESSSGGGSITEASMASDVLVLEGDSLEDVALLSPWSDRDALLFPPNFAEWKTQVPFAVLYDTKSYLAVLTTSFGTSLDGDLIERGFSLQSLHHSFLPNFVEAMDASGPDGLYGLEDGSQLEHQRISSREPFEEIELTHTSVVAQDPADPNPSAPQSDVVGFSSWSPHRLYNWELFVHIPLRIAERLREEGKYADALTWLHRVLDPSWASQPYASTPTTDANEAWRPRPLFDPLPFTDPELKAELWADGPFDVHAVAENDPEVYRFAVARQYVETLTAWGDHLFARDSIESIAEATQIYLYAQQFLGPRPTRLELQTDRGSGLTFAQLLTANGSGGSTADGLFNPLTELENVLTEEHSSVPTIRVDAASIDPGDMTGYFCTPDNHRHLQLWDVLEDRLHKIRHCMNIQGIVRVLPLFEPPIDPGALVAAAAAGLDLSQVAATRWVSPHIRFPAMMALARSLAQSLQRLGGALQQALQSQDAEALTMLRQAHEVELLELAEDVRRGQVAEATLSQESLEESKKITAFRRDHFAELIDVGPLATEYAEQTLQIVSQGLRTTIGIMRGTAAVMGAIPRFHAQAGFAIGPSFGNPELTEPSKSGGDALAAVADVLGIAANLSGVAGRWKRRKQDWQLSLGMAERELTQLDVQIEAAAERLAIAKQELANHKRQIEQSREVEAVLRSRFSSEDLFGWMVGELTHLHSQSYHLAVEVARKAELCLRREIGLKATSYVGAHHFNASRKGLLAGDRLLADLDRMEVAYVELDRREHEITKHVSLKRLDPQALIRLQRDGACTFSIPEVLYDLDFPGHYKRRIKAVSVSIPCVTGPFASVNGTLTLLRSQVRTDTAVMDTYEDAANYSHERWMEQVALSGGQDDSGTFNFDLRDAKYLRFEHRGAVSEWSLELAGSTTGTDGVKRPQFDWSSIADVVLHVRYTARHDSSLQPTAIDGVKAALDKIRADSEGMQLALSFAHDAPDAWHAALTADASTSVQMQMPLDWDRLPYLVQALNPTVSAARPILIAPASPDVTTAISVQGATTHSFGSATVDMPFGDGAFWTAAELVGATASPGPDEQLTVELSDPGLANVTTAGSLDTSKLEDVIVLLTLDFDPSV